MKEDDDDIQEYISNNFSQFIIYRSLMIFIFTLLFIFFHSFMYNKSFIYDKFLQLYWKEKRIDYAFGYVVSVIALVYLIWSF